MIATGAGGDGLPINVINIGDPMSTATSPNPALDNVQVLPRFESFKANIEHMVVEVVKDVVVVINAELVVEKVVLVVVTVGKVNPE